MIQDKVRKDNSKIGFSPQSTDQTNPQTLSFPLIPPCVFLSIASHINTHNAQPIIITTTIPNAVTNVSITNFSQPLNQFCLLNFVKWLNNFTQFQASIPTIVITFSDIVSRSTKFD